MKTCSIFSRLAKVLFLILVFAIQAFQDQEKDSVEMLINKKMPYVEKVEALKKLVNKNQDFEKGIFLLNRTISLAKKNKDAATEGSMLRLKGKAYYFRGTLDSASFYLYKSLAILEKEHTPKELAFLYNDLGKFYRKTKDFPRALKNYNRALEIYEKLKDTEGVAIIYNESGVVYEYMGENEEALSRYQKSLDIQIERKDLVGQGYALEFMGGNYLIQKKMKLAEDYLLQALNIRQQTKDDFAIALNQYALGNLYLETGDLKKVEYFFKASNGIAANINYLELMTQNYHQLAQLAEKQGNYSAAYQYLQTYKKFNDSIFNLGKTKQIEELSVKYETAEKDVEILAQKSAILKRNVGVYSLLGLLLLGFVYYKNYRNKQKIRLQKEILNQQDLATKAVMDAEDNERKRMATHLHDGIGQLLTAANMNVNMMQEYKEDEITFEKLLGRTSSILADAIADVRTLSHQIMPNQLIKNSLGNAVRDLIEKSKSPKLYIDLKIEDLGENLDQNVQIVIFRIIQECINNTIKHAEAKTISIAISQTPHLLKTTIIDDGKGFNPLKVPKSSDGMGLDNIRSRIAILKGTILIESAEGKGTKIQVEIPVVAV